MSEPKLCINCELCYSAGSGLDLVHFCSAGVISVVDGKPETTCRTMRSGVFSDVCGKDAKWFKPKELYDYIGEDFVVKAVLDAASKQQSKSGLSTKEPDNEVRYYTGERVFRLATNKDSVGWFPVWVFEKDR